MQSTKPKIVVFDLETLPNLPEALKKWTQLTGRFPGDNPTMKADVSTIICFGFKVHGSGKKAKCVSAWNFKSRWKKNVNDDYGVCKFAYETLKDADVVVTNNGRSFDWKFLQTRLILNGFPALPKIIHIDNKVMSKSNLYITSNSLKNQAALFTKTRKMENEGWELWVKVHGRVKSAMREMAIYCCQDVESSDQVFTVFKPFAKGLPNANLWRRDGVETCPSCGSHNIQFRGEQVTKEKIWRRIQCQDCGSWGKVTKHDKLKGI